MREIAGFPSLSASNGDTQRIHRQLILIIKAAAALAATAKVAAATRILAMLPFDSVFLLAFRQPVAGASQR